MKAGQRTVSVDFANCHFVSLPDERVGKLLVDGSKGFAVCGLKRQFICEFYSFRQ